MWSYLIKLKGTDHQVHYPISSLKCLSICIMTHLTRALCLSCSPHPFSANHSLLACNDHASIFLSAIIWPFVSLKFTQKCAQIHINT